jgi:putative ABC transport system permease protein
MTILNIAAKNVRRQLGNYAAFIISNAFSTMVFFLFVSLYFSEDVAAKIDIDYKLLGLFKISAILICVFAVIFLWYSAALFLRQRKQQLGTYMLVGMRQRQLAGVLVIEHLILGSVATIAGILIGIVFLRLFSMFLLALMRLHVTFYAGISARAVLLSLAAFLALHLFAGLSSASTIYRVRLIDMIRATRLVEPKPKARWLLIVMAVCGIGCGYGLVIGMNLEKFELSRLLLILVTTILGTFALFGGAFAGVLSRMRQRSIRKNDGVGILANGELAFRVRKNARLLATVAVFNAVSITAAGTVFSFYTDMAELKKEIEKRAPHSFSAIVENRDVGERLLEVATSTTNERPVRNAVLEVVLPDPDIPFRGGLSVDAIVSESSYLELGYEPLMLQDDGAGLIVADPYTRALRELSYDEYLDRSIILPGKNSELAQTVIDVRIEQLFPSWQIGGMVVLVIRDETFSEILRSDSPAKHIAIMDFESPEKTWDVYEYLTRTLPEETLDSYVFYYRGMIGNLGLLLFVGTFIGVTLILANGSVLYFRQLMEAADSKDRYRLAAHLGFTRRQIVGSIHRQLALVFSMPFIVGLVHALVALKLLELLTGVSVWSAHIAVVASYILIYAVFFLANNRAYRRIAGVSRYQ